MLTVKEHEKIHTMLHLMTSPCTMGSEPCLYRCDVIELLDLFVDEDKDKEEL